MRFLVTVATAGLLGRASTRAAHEDTAITSVFSEGDAVAAASIGEVNATTTEGVMRFLTLGVTATVVATAGLAPSASVA